MQINSLMVTDIGQQANEITSGYGNFQIASVNDHVVRLSVMTEPFYWHAHPNSDETFLCVEGSLFIDLEDSTVELLPGQLFTVPKNVRHKTRPNGPRSVNLTFEIKDIETTRFGE